MMSKPDTITKTVEICERGENGVLLPHQCTLKGFTESTAERKGLHLKSLPALTRLVLRTQNSEYKITVVEPEEWKVLVKGGRFFAQETMTFLCGSGYGGTLLKVAWIGIGMRCELSNETQRVVTSPVVDFEILENDVPGPF